MPTPILRRLAPADAEAAAAVIRTAFAAQTLATDPPSSALRETATSVRAHLAEHGGAGAEGEAGLVGLVLWAERDGGLYLGRLAVLPRWRGHGLARALIAEAEAEARRRALPRLHLRVRLALDDNRRLFTALGFQSIDEGAHPGYAEPTFAMMEKALA
ncbi:MAG TPA: GNAT family N-acetyltransferase [Roseiarcus sp.]|jgi:predicted N-acetyltransferase YhbS